MKAKKWFKSILAASLAGILCFSVAACDKGNTPVTPDDGTGSGGEDPNTGTVTPVQIVGVSIAAGAQTTIREGDSVQLTATVTVKNPVDPIPDESVTWSVQDENGNPSDVLAVTRDGLVTVKNPVTVNTVINVVATSNLDPTRSAKHTFTVKPTVKGQLDDLTSEVLEAVSGDNITFSGTTTLVHKNYTASNRDQSIVSHSVVMMDTDAWYASYYEEGYEEYPITYNYRKGAQVEGGHTLQSYSVNKDNEPTLTVETDGSGKPYIWEKNNYENYLGGLGADGIEKKFRHEEGSTEYEYIIQASGAHDPEPSKDEYLMAYLSWSLAPAIPITSDGYVRNFTTFRLILEDGKITGIHAETEPDQAFSSDGETVSAEEWYEVVLTISDVGSTEIPKPVAFEAPEKVEILQAAINQLKTAENYTFRASERMISGQEVDESEYISASVPVSVPAGPVATPLADTPDYYTSHVATSGTIGTVGYVTSEAIVFEKTGKYTSSLDEYTYYINYEGYKKRDDTHYEVFEDHLNANPDNVTVKGLVGVEIRNGDMFEKEMPNFEFSPNLFEYNGAVGTTYSVMQDGTAVSCQMVRFSLRSDAAYVTSDIVKEIAADSHRYDGVQIMGETVVINVLVKMENGMPGEFVSVYGTSYPYGGTYVGSGDTIGIVTTTYVDKETVGTRTSYYPTFGETTLKADAFTEPYYIEREWRPEWNQYKCSDYAPDHRTTNADGSGYYGYYEESTVVFDFLYGEGSTSKLFKPELLMNLIADDVGYPRFMFSKKEDGTYKDWIEVRIAFNNNDDRIDRNGKPKDMEAFMGPSGELTVALAKEGFTYDATNSGRPTPTTDFYYATYTKGNIQVVFESNGSKYLFIDFYKTGDWFLDRSKW